MRRINRKSREARSKGIIYEATEQRGTEWRRIKGEKKRGKEKREERKRKEMKAMHWEFK